MVRQPNVGRACGWLVSAVFWSWVEKSSDFPDRFRSEKWNARAHSVRAHLQHFQSRWSYRAHALSSVVKSSLRQLDMSRETSSKTNWLKGSHWIKDTIVLTFLRLRDWRPREPSSQFVFELVSRDPTSAPPPLSLSLSLSFPFLMEPFGIRRTFSCIGTQTMARIKCVSRIHHWAILVEADTCTSPTKSQKKRTFGVGCRQSPFSILSLTFSSLFLLSFFLNTNQTRAASCGRAPEASHENAGTETAFRQDHLQAFPKKRKHLWAQRSVDAIKPV